MMMTDNQAAVYNMGEMISRELYAVTDRVLLLVTSASYCEYLARSVDLPGDDPIETSIGRVALSLRTIADQLQSATLGLDDALTRPLGDGEDVPAEWPFR